MTREQQMAMANNEIYKSFLKIFERTARIANLKCGDTKDERQSTFGIDKDGGYKCIHLNVDRFLSGIQPAIDYKIEERKKRHSGSRIKFLDIGCGVGQKVFFARALGLEAYGLELRKPLIAAAKQFLKWIDVLPFYPQFNERSGLGGIKEMFIQADALTYDYKGFDILYFYCPLFQERLQAKLEERIAETASVGTIVVPFLPKGIFSFISDASLTKTEIRLKQKWKVIGKTDNTNIYRKARR